MVHVSGVAVPIPIAASTRDGLSRGSHSTGGLLWRCIVWRDVIVASDFWLWSLLQSNHWSIAELR